ncbi:MAG TPA: hypothetical protein VHZ24_04855 [Pirellulales bacterium]|jgi:hypothetical protein|nr:hypothetical protein [Pirellulales bacterium]
MRRFALAVAFAWLCRCKAFAAEPGGPPADAPVARVARLITEMRSDSFAARSHAIAGLEALGPAARQQLEAAADDPDPEVHLRARELLVRLKMLDLWSAGQAKLPAGKVTAGKLLQQLADQTGNHILLGDQYGNFHDQEIELDRPTGEFWSLVDEVCRKSSNRVRVHYDTRQPGLVVVAGEPAKFPVAYYGPVRAQICSARRVFTEVLDYEELDSELSHTFQLNLQMSWEDRFRLVAYRAQVELASAVTDTGDELPASQPSGNGWNVASSGTRQLSMSLRLHPPATKARELDKLVLRWGLVAVGDMATFDVANWELGKPYQQDDVELIVESVQAGADGRYEVTVLVNRDLVMPDPQEIVFQENELELLDLEGRPLRKQGQTNSVIDSGAKMKVTFQAEHDASAPATLRLNYPRLRAERDAELVFRHVPLPVGKPE